jgi:hypothetical protein
MQPSLRQTQLQSSSIRKHLSAILCLTMDLQITPPVLSATFFHALCGPVPLQRMPRDESAVRNPSETNSPATAVSILLLSSEIVILCWAHGSALPEGQVSGQSANSAPRRFKMVTSPPDYPANCGIGITDFQNCCPATGKVRSIPTGTDTFWQESLPGGRSSC